MDAEFGRFRGHNSGIRRVLALAFRELCHHRSPIAPGRAKRTSGLYSPADLHHFEWHHHFADDCRDDSEDSDNLRDDINNLANNLLNNLLNDLVNNDDFSADGDFAHGHRRHSATTGEPR